MNRTHSVFPQNVSSFKIINDYLGKGFSSKVSLVEDPTTKRKYALKTVCINN
jgi:hypothetical protein